MLVLEDKKQEEFVKVILGVPERFVVGQIQSVNYEVVCVYNTMEFIKTPEDTLTVLDKNGNDVSSYQWWTVPGKYNLTVTTYAICPKIGADKAPTLLQATDLTLSQSHAPVGLRSQDREELLAALQDASPIDIKARDKSFDHRGAPHNASIINLAITSENSPSSIEADPELFANRAPSNITSAQILEANNAPLALTAVEKLGSSSSPTGVNAWDADSDDPRNASAHNLSFLDNPDGAPTNAQVIDLLLRVGPESITSFEILGSSHAPQVLEYAPELDVNNAPSNVIYLESPASLSESPTSVTHTVLGSAHAPSGLNAALSGFQGVSTQSLSTLGTGHPYACYSNAPSDELFIPWNDSGWLGMSDWQSYCSGQPMVRRGMIEMFDVLGFFAGNLSEVEKFEVLSGYSADGVLIQIEEYTKVVARRQGGQSVFYGNMTCGNWSYPSVQISTLGSNCTVVFTIRVTFLDGTYEDQKYGFGTWGAAAPAIPGIDPLWSSSTGSTNQAYYYSMGEAFGENAYRNQHDLWHHQKPHDLTTYVSPDASQAPTSLTAVDPSQMVSQEIPSSLTVADIDKDEDGAWAVGPPADYDDNDASLQTAPVYQLKVLETGVRGANNTTIGTLNSGVILDAGGTFQRAQEVLRTDTVPISANPDTFTSMAAWSSRPTYFFQGWWDDYSTQAGEISYDPYSPNTTVSYNTGDGWCGIKAEYQLASNGIAAQVFMMYTTVAATEAGTTFLDSATAGNIETAEGNLSLLPWNTPASSATQTYVPQGLAGPSAWTWVQANQHSPSTGLTGSTSYVTLTAPTTISSGGNSYTFQGWRNATQGWQSASQYTAGISFGQQYNYFTHEVENSNKVTFALVDTHASLSTQVIYWATYA